MDATEPAESQFIRRGTAKYRRASCALLFGGLATFNLLYCVQPIMPVFSREFAVGADETALALSLSTAVLAFSLLFAAPLADRVGRKPMMLGSTTISAVLVLCGSMLDNWTSFLVTRALLGLSLGGLPAIAMTYLAEEIEPAAANAAMGAYIGGNALGGVLARLMNGAVADLISWRAALAISGILGLVGSLVIWRMLPPSRVFVPNRRRSEPAPSLYLRHLRTRAILLLLSEGALLSGMLVTSCNLLGYRLLAPPFDLSVGLSSLVFLAYLLGTPTTVVATRLAGRTGSVNILIAGLALMICGIILMIGNSLVMIATGMGILTVGYFAAHSSASAMVSIATPVGRGQAASLYLFSFYGGSGLISWIGGHVWKMGHWPAVSAYLSVLAGLALLCAISLRTHLILNSPASAMAAFSNTKMRGNPGRVEVAANGDSRQSRRKLPSSRQEAP